MRSFIRFLSLALVSVMLFSLVACDGGKTENPDLTTAPAPETTAPSVETTAPDTEPEDTDPPAPVYEDVLLNVVDVLDNVKIHGRSMVCADGLAIDWSASGIEFNADCKGDVKVTFTSTYACKFAVYVDGTQADDVKVAEGTAEYAVASGLAEGLHNIRIVKKSDNAVENTPDILTSVGKIALCGKLADRPADRELLIEFIGDSITCGLGTVAPNSLETDATVTYAYKAAEALGCDYSFVSVSGIGVLQSTEQNNGLLISDIYSYTNYYRDPAAEYKPARKADIVVIGLNTNDNGRITNSDRNAYWEKSDALISQIRAIHGEDVKIVWVSALMFQAGAADSMISYSFRNRLGGESEGYYYFEATPNSAGAFSHPSVEGHAKNAEILVKYLKEKFGI